MKIKEGLYLTNGDTRYNRAYSWWSRHFPHWWFDYDKGWEEGVYLKDLGKIPEESFVLPKEYLT